jgi:hypothetical protein
MLNDGIKSNPKRSGSLEKVNILTLIHALLYLTYVILDYACFSISSWHILLKCSHRLLILVLMVLTSITIFTASNISDFIMSALEDKTHLIF